MSFQRDQKGFIFSLDATFAMLVVLIVMAGVAHTAESELVYGQHGYLRLERYANDTLEVLQLTGTIETIVNFVRLGANENAENLAREELLKILPAEVQFKLVLGDNRLTVYPSDAPGWETAFAEAEEIATATRMSLFEGVGDNTVALWHFDEGTGNKAYDETQNNNDGTISGAVSWTIGRYGSGLDFPGASGDYVSVPHSESLAPTDGLPELTVEAWVYPRDNAASLIAGKFAWDDDGWFLKIEPGESSENKFRFTIWVGSNLPSGHGRYLDDAGSLNEWIHLAMVFDKGNMSMVINGENKTGDSTSWGTPLSYVRSASENLFIGCEHCTQNFFNGIIDEVLIENRALTVEEIAADAAGAMREFGPITLHVWRGAPVE